MPEAGFKVKVLEKEVVAQHLVEGHIYRFPILPNHKMSLNGSKVEANPPASREASKLVFQAYNAALMAFNQNRNY
jgi:hypothetical protein